MNKFNISQANPLRLYQQADVLQTISNVTNYKTFNPNYNKREFDEDFFYRNIDSWIEKRQYIQPYQQGDTIRLQWTGTDLLLGSVNPYLVRFINCKGEIVATETPDFLSTFGILFNGDYLWEFDYDLINLPIGKYVVQIRCSDLPPNLDTFLISEPIEIKQKHEDSKLISYRNSENIHDIYYETGMVFYHRINASFTELVSNSKFEVYDDQPMNLTFLGGVKYRQWTLEFKDIPQWVADKLELIFLHDGVKIDDKFYTRIEGSNVAFTPNKVNSLGSAKITLRESINNTNLVVNELYSRKANINTNGSQLSKQKAFYVESLTNDDTTITIQKYFLGQTDFLNYLNSTIAGNYFVGNVDYAYFSVNSDNELCLNTNKQNVWDLYVTFDINNLIDTYVELDVENISSSYFEIEISRNTINANFAIFTNDGQPMTEGISTGYLENFNTNILTPKATIFVFIDNMEDVNLSNSTIDVIGVGGNLKDITYGIQASSISLKYFKNNFFLNTISLNNIDVSNNNLSTNEIIKLFMYLWEVQNLGSGGIIDTSNQTPLAPLGNEQGINIFKQKLLNLGWSITTD